MILTTVFTKLHTVEFLFLLYIQGILLGGLPLEDTAHGTISMATYYYYFTAGGNWFLLFVFLFLLIFGQVSTILTTSKFDISSVSAGYRTIELTILMWLL